MRFDDIQSMFWLPTKPTASLSYNQFSSIFGATRASDTTTESNPDPFSDKLDGIYLVGVLVVTTLLLIHHLVVLATCYIRTLACLQDVNQRFYLTSGTGWSWYKSHLHYAPLFRARHSRTLNITPAITLGTLPTRIQALAFAFILTGNIMLCTHNVPWGASAETTLSAFRVRFGKMAILNLMPVTIMTTARNPLIALLKMSFDSFNFLHRWFGRIVVVQAVAHVLFWLISTIQTGHGLAVKKSMSTPFIVSGLVSVITLIVILLQSIRMLRSAFYETFLHLHVILVITSLVFLWAHLKGLTPLRYLITAVVFWALERIARLCTLLARSIGRVKCRAIVYLLPGDAVRVTVTTPRPCIAQPGQYIYLTIPEIGLWTAHPFSIAWTEREKSYMLHNSSIERDIERFSSMSSDPKVELRHSLSMVIRRRGGFTNALYETAERRVPMNSVGFTLRTFIEGPYGVGQSMSSYGTVILFAGGIGITHQMPYLRELIEGFANGTVAVRKLTLVWVVKSPRHLEWIKPWISNMLRMEGRREVLQILMYVTRPMDFQDISSASMRVQIFHGRPDIEILIVEASREQVGCMGLSVCGPGGLADEVRKIARRLIRGGRNIDLIEQRFTY